MVCKFPNSYVHVDGQVNGMADGENRALHCSLISGCFAQY